MAIIPQKDLDFLNKEIEDLKNRLTRAKEEHVQDISLNTKYTYVVEDNRLEFSFRSIYIAKHTNSEEVLKLNERVYKDGKLIIKLKEDRKQLKKQLLELEEQNNLLSQVKKAVSIDRYSILWGLIKFNKRK